NLTVSATQTDTAGNTSTAANTTVRLDNVAPSALSITTPIEIDDIINGAEDADVLITGAGAEANAQINISITDSANNAPVTAQVTADGSGNWTLAGNEVDVSALANGTLTISATQTDEAGNQSNAETATVSLDNTIASPSISTPISTDGIINAAEDSSVLITGSGAEPGALLTVNIGGVQVQVTADSSGNWTIQSNELDISSLNNGALTVTVTQTDSAGNTSSGATQTITLDNRAPVAPVITTPIATDNVINAAEDNSLSLSGTAEADATIDVSIIDSANNAPVTAQVTADGSGNWTLTGSEIDVSSLTNGSLTINVTQTDVAGNRSNAATATVNLDNTIVAPSITTPIESDDIINAAEDNDVLITGTGAEANATVDIAITDGSYTDTAQVTADGSGNWSIAGSELDVSSFNNGNLTVSATQTDTAGNT
ncbi:Ig-like domain-containing protein, partial [Catenovulum sp. 2E275]|uniref:beta strand repeat-containing protein n=1 Tax=Catenovulum sp. 2E275 TaxID=2980497 RepID=UPI0021CFBBB9